METIGALLRPHSEQLQQLALALSCVRLLRGLSLVLRMRDRSNGDAVSIRPLLGALVLATLGIRLAQLNDDQLMLQINSTSLLLNTGFLVICYRCASPGYKYRIWRRTLLILLLIGSCLCYSLVEEPATARLHLSVMMTGTTSLLILMGLLQRTANVLGCLISILVVTSKLLYALSVLNRFMWYQNLWVLCLDLLRIGFSLRGSKMSALEIKY